MGIFYREKAFHARKKIRKKDFAPSEKYACYAPAIRVADENKMLHPCAILLCDKWKYGGSLGFEITLPFLITPGTWSKRPV